MKQLKHLKPAIAAQLLRFSIMTILIVSQTSCFKQYYQTNTRHEMDSLTIQQLLGEQRNFIVHTADRPFALNNVRVSGDSLYGDIGMLNSKNDRLLNPAGEFKNPMSRSEKKVVSSQVHVYTNSTVTGSGHIGIALHQINRVDLYSPDQKAIRNSRITGIIVVTLSVAAAVGIAAIVISGISSMVFVGPW